MKGIILAAGMGTRLKPLTDVIPKCLVPVNGKPMLDYQLECLAAAGLEECVLVVGYRASQIANRFGNHHLGMGMSYVQNELFQQTNNLYSLWLARNHLDDDILLLESDVLFEDDLVQQLIQHPAKSVAVVSRYEPPMNGTVILAANNIANDMVLKVDQTLGFDYTSALKSVNIYKLSECDIRESVIPELSRFVDSGRTDQYYEAIFSDLIAQKRLQMSILRSEDLKWVEVDTQEDLSAAEALFGKEIHRTNHATINR